MSTENHWLPPWSDEKRMTQTKGRSRHHSIRPGVRSRSETSKDSAPTGVGVADGPRRSSRGRLARVTAASARARARAGRATPAQGGVASRKVAHVSPARVSAVLSGAVASRTALLSSGRSST